MFRSAGCFSSSLDVLHGDVGINKLQCRNSCTGLKWSREVIKQQFLKISVVDSDPQWECGTGSRRAKLTQKNKLHVLKCCMFFRGLKASPV